MPLKITIVVGNPKANSRTRKVAELLVERLFLNSSRDLRVIDLAEYTETILTWPSDEMTELTTRVAQSDVVVFASPTYKASYTGILKAFLDRYPANGLEGVVAIPVFTGADKTHAMAPTVTLVPLLFELGAAVLGRGFYFVASHMDQVEEIVNDVANEYAANLRRFAIVAAGARDAGTA